MMGRRGSKWRGNPPTTVCVRSLQRGSLLLISIVSRSPLYRMGCCTIGAAATDGWRNLQLITGARLRCGGAVGWSLLKDTLIAVVAVLGAGGVAAITVELCKCAAPIPRLVCILLQSQHATCFLGAIPQMPRGTCPPCAARARPIAHIHVRSTAPICVLISVSMYGRHDDKC